MSGSRVPFSDHPFDPLPGITRRRVVCSGRQLEHYKPIGLSKCHPITMNPLTARVSHKHPSTLTNFLPEEKSIQTRDISQDIGNGIK